MARRRWIAATLAGVAALALTGCGLPGGADGTLTDDWPALAEPVGHVPDGGVCHKAFMAVVPRDSYFPVDCAEMHQAETVHVGTFSGAQADLATPPTPGSPGMRASRAECEDRANSLLGGVWRSGPIAVVVVLPSPPAWSGGARWYRCDVGETVGVGSDFILIRTGSLRGSLTDSSDLRYRCFQPTPVAGTAGEMTPVACAEKHRAEFVGIWTAPAGSYSGFQNNENTKERECRRMAAEFAKVPDDGMLRFRTGVRGYPPTEQEWEDGSRGVQCFLWMNDRDVTRSMKGAGTAGLPVG